MTEKEAEPWFRFSDKLLETALSIFGEAEVPITARGASEPKVLAMTLLVRSISNFTGVVMLSRQGMIVEARILARNCYENLLWIGGLASQGDAFVKAMLHDENKNKVGRGELLLGKYQLDDEVEKRLRAQLRVIHKQPKPSKSLNPNSVAQDGPLDHGYVIYSQLSADAAHPSLTALARYIGRADENGVSVRTIDVSPLPRPGEIATTMDWACNALIGICVGVNQILEGTPAGQTLLALADEYQSLARRVAGKSE